MHQSRRIREFISFFNRMLKALNSFIQSTQLHCCMLRLHQDGKKSPRTKLIDQEEEMANGHLDAPQIAPVNLSNLCPCAGST